MDAMYKAVRGTQDVLPADSGKWQYMEQTALSIAQDFGYREIRTPSLNRRRCSSGRWGDHRRGAEGNVHLPGQGERSVTLRPEGTAGAARAALEHGLLAGALPVKTSYVTSCYRYEKPQAGRLREFHQFGVECFGPPAPGGCGDHHAGRHHSGISGRYRRTAAHQLHRLPGVPGQIPRRAEGILRRPEGRPVRYLPGPAGAQSHAYPGLQVPGMCRGGRRR